MKIIFRSILIFTVLLILSNNSYSTPIFQGGNGIYDNSNNLLKINITWSGFDTIVNGVQTLSIDTDASLSPFTLGTTDLISSSIAGASLLGIASQALIVDLGVPVTSSGSHSFSFIFSNVSNNIIGQAQDIGGNWNDGFGTLSGFSSFQEHNQFNVVNGNISLAPVPEPTSLALLSLGLAGVGFSRNKKKIKALLGLRQNLTKICTGQRKLG